MTVSGGRKGAKEKVEKAIQVNERTRTNTVGEETPVLNGTMEANTFPDGATAHRVDKAGRTAKEGTDFLARNQIDASESDAHLQSSFLKGLAREFFFPSFLPLHFSRVAVCFGLQVTSLAADDFARWCGFDGEIYIAQRSIFTAVSCVISLKVQYSSCLHR